MSLSSDFSFVRSNLSEILPPLRFTNGKFAGGVFEAEIMQVIYETEPAALEAIIPPGLTLRGEPYVSLILNDFIKTDFGRGYKESVLAITVTDDANGLDGVYPVALTLNQETGDQADFAGREFGFPKKLGSVAYTANKATIARHGITYASFGVDTTQAPNDAERFEAAANQTGKLVQVPNAENGTLAMAMFNYLWPPALRDVIAPEVVPAWFGFTPSGEVAVGAGDVELVWAENDPWASLPVVNIIGGSVVSGIATLDVSTSDLWAEVSAEAYWPYSWLGWDLPTDPIDRV